MSLHQMVDLSTLADDEPCRAVAGVHALYGLGLDDDAVQANWPKLAGRPTGQVRAFLANIEGERPELIQTRLTEFGKRVSPL